MFLCQEFWKKANLGHEEELQVPFPLIIRVSVF